MPSVSPQPSSPTFSRNPAVVLDHVVIIVEENKPATSILGNIDARFLNTLATDSAVAMNYTAVAHPSLPNYLAMTSGSTAGITDDCNPPGPSCQARVPSITGELDASGHTWKMYAEGMPTPCAKLNSGNYAVKHNPFLYYPSVTKDPAYCAAHDVPFTQLSHDLASSSTLPDYAFISPDLCNDTHDCPVRTGDAWLSRVVPAILASAAFTSQNSLLVITWDEGSQSDNAVSTIFAGPAAKTGYRSEVDYNHYSLLHTIEEAWGLAPLTNNDGGAPTMADLLR
ncbi:MAG: alkaline phosphatase family protein [Microbacteriaceae bacterium]